MEPIQGNVSIDAQNIMPIIKKWLYSDKDIFIREVVSNGCDAITKLRMVDSAAAQGCSIHVEVDKAARELRFIDDGVGMTEDGRGQDQHQSGRVLRRKILHGGIRQERG